MYKCNRCGTIFDSPAEQQREVEYYPIPFGNGSEPFGGGYYECCPECGDRDFDRYDEDEYIDDLQNELEVTKKALALAVETMRYELGRCAIKNLYKMAMENLKDNLNMKFDTEMCEWYLEQAKEMKSD